MRKLLTAILCISLVLFGMTVTTFADDVPVFTIGKVTADGDTVDVPVYLTGIPEGLDNVMAIDFKYAYDANVLEYQSTTQGTAEGSLFSASDGSVHWADGTDLETGEANVTASTIGEENPLFILTFKILGEPTQSTNITTNKVALTGGALEPGNVFVLVKPVEGSYKTSPGRIIFSKGDNGNNGDSGNTTPGEGNEGITPDDGDDNNGTTTPGGDDNTGDNNGTTTPGEDEGSSGGSSGGSGNAGGLKPNTGGTSNGGSSSGGSSSGGSSSGGSSSGFGSGGGIAVLPQTPPASTTPTKASEVFSDVSDDHWAAQYALALYNAGIVSGDSEKRANLENQITREETSKLALLVNGIEADASAVLDVADADAVSDWAKSFMATAISKGIFSGYEDGTVRPANRITREEMVTVIIKSLKIDVDTAATTSFVDSDSITWSAPYVAKAVELGFVNGYGDNSFKPDSPITRAEAFTIFARVLEYKNK